ncbi:hypothetical protein LTS12_028480, partial [Elasticomyces elasticus]
NAGIPEPQPELEDLGTPEEAVMDTQEDAAVDISDDTVASTARCNATDGIREVAGVPDPQPDSEDVRILGGAAMGTPEEAAVESNEDVDMDPSDNLTIRTACCGTTTTMSHGSRVSFAVEDVTLSLSTKPSTVKSRVGILEASTRQTPLRKHAPFTLDLRHKAGASRSSRPSLAHSSHADKARASAPGDSTVPQLAPSRAKRPKRAHTSTAKHVL